MGTLVAPTLWAGSVRLDASAHHHAATGFPFLTALVVVPLVSALVAFVVPRMVPSQWKDRAAEGIGLLGSAVTLALAVAMAVRFKVGDAAMQFTSNHRWAPGVGVRWDLGVDGISLFLVVLAALLVPLAIMGGRVRRDPTSYVVWLLILEAGCLGSFMSLDLLLFFVFFESTLVPVYFVIAGWGYANRAAAAVKFFVYTFLGSALLLVGIVAVAFIHQKQTGVLTFDVLALQHTHLGASSQILLFLAFTSAFAVKAPIFPFHTWSPDAYGESPVAGVVILSAVMAKMGTYGILRFDLTLFPQAVKDLAPLFLVLGVVGILYGAVVACATSDLRRLLAYSSLAHIGFIVVGIFALTTEGVAGGVLQMVNHGLVISVLFLVVGWIFQRRQTTFTYGMRGLQRVAPVLAGVFTIAMMASIGLPGLNGFVGEFMVLAGTFLTHRWYAMVATFGVVLAALYLLWAYQQVFHHEPDAETKASVSDIGWREVSIVAPLVILIVVLGVFPKPVLDRITPAVDQLVLHVDDSTCTPPPGRSLDADSAGTYRCGGQVISGAPATATTPTSTAHGGTQAQASAAGTGTSSGTGTGTSSGSGASTGSTGGNS